LHPASKRVFLPVIPLLVVVSSGDGPPRARLRLFHAVPRRARTNLKVPLEIDKREYFFTIPVGWTKRDIDNDLRITDDANAKELPTII
jgi:hypothetical protein